MQETASTATERTSKTDYESKGIYYSNNLTPNPTENPTVVILELDFEILFELQSKFILLLNYYPGAKSSTNHFKKFIGGQD